MASFTKNELELFEDLFNLKNGHVLNMSRKEFEKFIYRSIDIDITTQDYKNKVKKHRNYFTMPQIYRFIVECEKDKSLKLLNELIDYIENNNLKRIDEDLLIKAKTILKNKSNEKEDFEQYSKTVDSDTIKRPFPAYDGNEPYIFISYAHKDSKIVFKEIERFQNEGYNIWYDDGLIPGNDWADEIAHALCNSSLVVVFISKNSISSENVKDEINFALDEKIDVVPIYLEETQLPRGLKLRLSRKDAIFKYALSDEDYLKKYTKTFENIHSHKKDSTSSNGDSYVILQGCTKKQSLIFKDFCNYCLDKSFDAEIDPMTILDIAGQYYDEENPNDLADKVRPSLKNLEKNNYITSNGSSLGMGVSACNITFTGFHFYLENIAEDKNIYLNVSRAISIDKLSEIDEISEKYDIPPSIVEMLVKSFKRDDYLIYNNDLSDITLTPGGEEYFEEMLNQ